MKSLCALVALVCASASAQVQTIELKEHPPLQPLNWCTDSNGVTRGQLEPCGPGTTVGSSIRTVKPSGPAEQPEPVVASRSGIEAARAPTAGVSGEPDGSFWKRWGTWLALALGAGLLLKWLRRSA